MTQQLRVSAVQSITGPELKACSNVSPDSVGDFAVRNCLVVVVGARRLL